VLPPWNYEYISIFTLVTDNGMRQWRGSDEQALTVFKRKEIKKTGGTGQMRT
jgi:hypothetical protein